MLCFVKHWLLLFFEFYLARVADKTFFWCISVTFHYFGLFSCQHSEIYNSKALRLAGNMDSQFLSDSVTSPIAGRVREWWDGGLFTPPPNVFPFVLQDREQARRWGVEREEERDVWKRGGEVERIDSVCWTQIKVCLVCRPHKTTCTHTHPKHSPRKTHRDSQTRDTRKTNSPCL